MTHVHCPADQGLCACGFDASPGPHVVEVRATPSPEEFAEQIDAACDTAKSSKASIHVMAVMIRARDAALTAPLRADVEDAKGALDDAAAHEDNDTASVADRIATLAEERDFYRSAWIAVLDVLHPGREPDDQFESAEVAGEVAGLRAGAERLARERAEVARLREALRPFAEDAAYFDACDAPDESSIHAWVVGRTPPRPRKDVTVGHLRAAARALAEGQP